MSVWNEPVLLGALIRAILYAVGAWWAELTVERIAAIMVAVEALLALVTRTLVTPNHLAEARVAAGLSPTDPTGGI